MKTAKTQNRRTGGTIGMKLKTAILMLLVTVLSLSCIVTANAAEIKDDGKYSLVLQCSGWSEGTIDGETSKIVRFDVADGEDSVSIAELTKGIVPFDGEHEFSHWSTDFSDTSKADDEIPISKFTWSGNVYLNDGTEVKFNNGFRLYGVFSDKPLKGTGTYYLTLDGLGGEVNGKYEITMTSSSSEYQTVDLTKYTPVRDGYTFVGWDLDGKYVTSVPADCFKEKDVVKVLATYTKNTFDNDGIVLTLNANGGQLNGKESNTYDYVGGRDSGASMSLLPYVPVKDGYTFNGWNTKSDGSGDNYKYVYWRIWDNNKETNKEFDKDTLITESNGYVRYKNVTLYASWTKTSGEPENPGNDTVKEIQSTGDIKAKIEFAKEVSKDYKLDIKPVEVKKDLADKNVKFIADINVLDGNSNVVNISNTKMKIRIALPDDLKGYNKYEVAYILNGEIKETISAAVENGYIVFETNHLSQYGIIATNTGNGTKSPQTGDNSSLALWFAVLLISGGAVIGTTVVSKKKKHNI